MDDDQKRGLKVGAALIAWTVAAAGMGLAGQDFGNDEGRQQVLDELGITEAQMESAAEILQDRLPQGAQVPEFVPGPSTPK